MRSLHFVIGSGFGDRCREDLIAFDPGSLFAHRLHFFPAQVLLLYERPTPVVIRLASRIGRLNNVGLTNPMIPRSNLAIVLIEPGTFHNPLGSALGNERKIESFNRLRDGRKDLVILRERCQFWEWAAHLSKRNRRNLPDDRSRLPRMVIAQNDLPIGIRSLFNGSCLCLFCVQPCGKVTEVRDRKDCFPHSPVAGAQLFMCFADADFETVALRGCLILRESWSDLSHNDILAASAAFRSRTIGGRRDRGDLTRGCRTHWFDHTIDRKGR